ncbi:hypothetical protein [Streptomyces erythrochromogenes]|uniref:hypothetical protein n=1 Tax=Streptomyces erythrochromogenes TaxID=285574 RepID=UPI00380B7EF6|nr:hypothetical protein OG489_36220 [Streptomyces erythrochromogenes]
MRDRLKKAVSAAGPIAMKAAAGGRLAFGVLKVVFTALSPEMRVDSSLHGIRRDLDEIETVLGLLPHERREAALEALACALSDAESSVAEALRALQEIRDGDDDRAEYEPADSG